METRFFQMMIVIKPMKRINKTIQMRRISILKKTTMKLKKRLTSKTMGIRHKKQRATVKILKRLTGFGQVQLFILQTTEANADQISHLQCQQPLKVCIKFKQVFFMTFLNKVSLTVNKKNKMYAQMEEPWSLSQIPFSCLKMLWLRTGITNTQVFRVPVKFTLLSFILALGNQLMEPQIPVSTMPFSKAH